MLFEILWSSILTGKVRFVSTQSCPLTYPSHTLCPVDMKYRVNPPILFAFHAILTAHNMIWPYSTHNCIFYCPDYSILQTRLSKGLFILVLRCSADLLIIFCHNSAQLTAFQVKMNLSLPQNHNAVMPQSLCSAATQHNASMNEP